MLHAPVAESLGRFDRLSQSHFQPIAGIELHYRAYRLEEWTPDQTLVVCLHGYKNNCYSFADLIPRLDRPAISLDLQGYGRSGLLRSTFTGLVDYLGDLKVVLDRLGAERVALVGHSMGSRVAAAWSAIYPERVARLVMIDGYYQWYPPSDWPHRMRRWLDQIDKPVKPPTRVDVERLEAFFLRQSPPMDRALVRYLAEHSYETLPDGSLVADWSPHHQRPTPNPFDDRQMREALLAVSMPALILQCNPAPDGAVEFNLHNPNLRIERIDGGHMLHWERPVAVAQAIHRWWEG